MSYKNLEIWRLAREMVIDIHKMTLEKLPKFEIFEEGSQIRKSSKSVSSTIVEGYGRRRYKQEFIRFLSYAIAIQYPETSIQDRGFYGYSGLAG